MTARRLHPAFVAFAQKMSAWVPRVEEFIAARYEVTLLKAERARWGYPSWEFKFLVEGRGGRTAPYAEWYDLTERDEVDSILKRDRDIKVYDDVPVGWPPESIPANPLFGYRGMSYEEWRASRRRGAVGSAGWYNLGDTQAGRTYFGADPQQAEYYANGFTPWQFKPGPGRPGVVIAVPRRFLRAEEPPHHIRRPRSAADVRSHELSHGGTIPIREVRGVWFLHATKVRPGKIEFEVRDHDGHITDGSRSAPSVQHIVVPAHHERRRW